LQRSEEEKGEKPPTSLFFSFGGEKMGLEKLDKIIEILSDEEEHTQRKSYDKRRSYPKRRSDLPLSFS